MAKVLFHFSLMLKVVQEGIHFRAIAPRTLSDAQRQLSMASGTCVVVSLFLSYSSCPFLFFQLGDGIRPASDVNRPVCVIFWVFLLKPDLDNCVKDDLVLFAAHFTISALSVSPVHDSIDESTGIAAPLVLIQRTFCRHCRLLSHCFFFSHMYCLDMLDRLAHRSNLAIRLGLVVHHAAGLMNFYRVWGL